MNMIVPIKYRIFFRKREEPCIFMLLFLYKICEYVLSDRGIRVMHFN